MNHEKAKKKLGVNFAEEMKVMTEDQLKALIVQANVSMQEAAEQLHANPKYIALVEALNEVKLAKKEVDSRQKAIIAYAVSLIQGDSHEAR